MGSRGSQAKGCLASGTPLYSAVIGDSPGRKAESTDDDGTYGAFRRDGPTVFVLVRNVWWRDLLFCPHPLCLSRKKRGVVLWQLGSATRREGALRSRDSFVNCPGDGVAAHCATLILRTAQSSSHRRYSTFRLDVMMISERRKSVSRAIDAPLTMGTRWTATTTFFGSDVRT